MAEATMEDLTAEDSPVAATVVQAEPEAAQH